MTILETVSKQKPGLFNVDLTEPSSDRLALAIAFTVRNWADSDDEAITVLAQIGRDKNGIVGRVQPLFRDRRLDGQYYTVGTEGFSYQFTFTVYKSMPCEMLYKAAESGICIGEFNNAF